MVIAVPDDATAGTSIVTADLSWGDWELREWTEAMVTVADGPTGGRSEVGLEDKTMN